MKQKRNPALPLCIVAMCAVLNIVGGTVALALHLPIYLDTLGTFVTAVLLGPVYGMLPGLISGVFSGITTDIYALYFCPVQIIVGLAAGLLFRTKLVHRWFMPLGTLLISLPGTIASGLISAFLFGGITSSGSTVLVQLLHHAGLNLTFSVILVQFFTDYADRLISVSLVLCLLAALPRSMRARIKGVSNGTL